MSMKTMKKVLAMVAVPLISSLAVPQAASAAAPKVAGQVTRIRADNHGRELWVWVKGFSCGGSDAAKFKSSDPSDLEAVRSVAVAAMLSGRGYPVLAAGQTP